MFPLSKGIEKLFAVLGAGLMGISIFGTAIGVVFLQSPVVIALSLACGLVGFALWVLAMLNLIAN
ncbi:MAG: hypothetical protein AUG51_02860 [Acidobacteria bacterium 13_1_20CM_3_53_8]|nr:MAG: hypothetical protein AUG51_02860 [Acidobacteria bacterium 13_1_20CM_3_53_8]